MLGVLRERGKDRIEGRLLGTLRAHGVLHVREHFPIVLVALHLLEAAPPQIANEKVLHPGEQKVDPVVEIAVQMQVRTAEIEARLANDLSRVVLAGSTW